MEPKREDKKARDRRHLIGIAMWGVSAFFLITGVQVTLGTAVAGLVAFAYVFTLGWFAEHGADLFG